MSKIIFLLLLVLLLPFSAFAQTNQTDWNTFTITTYYPSPHGVYNRMEVKRALSVGNFTDAPSGLGSVLDLDGGQLFVGESMILKSQASSNPPDGLAGQLIYVNNTTNNERMLKFYNGTAWVNATGYSACIAGAICPACPGARRCYSPDTSESCPSTQVCTSSSNICSAPNVCTSSGNVCSAPNTCRGAPTAREITWYVDSCQPGISGSLCAGLPQTRGTTTCNADEGIYSLGETSRYGGPYVITVTNKAVCYK